MKVEKVLEVILSKPGLTGGEIAKEIHGPTGHQPQINMYLHMLMAQGRVVRRETVHPYTYWPVGTPTNVINESSNSKEEYVDGLSKDQVKEFLKQRLEREGYDVGLAVGKEHGIDVLATRPGVRWIIETRGAGNPIMRLQSVKNAVGEVLMRMDNPEARYSVAFPAMREFERGWLRIPQLAKSRTGLTALFVREDGDVYELD